MRWSAVLLLALTGSCAAQGPGSSSDGVLQGAEPLPVSVGFLGSENFPFSQLAGEPPQLEGFEVSYSKRHQRSSCNWLLPPRRAPPATRPPLKPATY